MSLPLIGESGRTQHGHTALHVAAAYHRPLVVRWLLSAGADTTVVCKEHCGPVHMAAHAGSAASLSLLISHRAPDMRAPCGLLQCSALQVRRNATMR